MTAAVTRYFLRKQLQKSLYLPYFKGKMKSIYLFIPKLGKNMFTKFCVHILQIQKSFFNLPYIIIISRNK